MPPPVDPTHPPIKLSIRSNTGKNNGHTEKSCVVKPVVVAMEIVWNSPWIRLSSTLNVSVSTSKTQIMQVANPITVKKKAVSESWV